MIKLFFSNILVLLILSSSEAGVMDSFKFNGLVQSYDQKIVKLKCQGRDIEVPRSAIDETTIQSGANVNFHLTGEQTEKIFFPPQQKKNAPGTAVKK